MSHITYAVLDGAPAPGSFTITGGTGGHTYASDSSPLIRGTPEHAREIARIEAYIEAGDARREAEAAALDAHWTARDAAILAERARQGTVPDGCCPSLTIVDFSLPTQHTVYCEAHTPTGWAHQGSHTGLAGVDAWTNQKEWTWR